jgi:hypothetical protein
LREFAADPIASNRPVARCARHRTAGAPPGPRRPRLRLQLHQFRLQPQRFGFELLLTQP